MTPGSQTHPSSHGCFTLSVAVAKGGSLEPKVTRHDSLGLGWSFSENCFWATSLPYLWRKAKIRGKNKVSDADCYLDFFGINTSVFHGWKIRKEYHKEEERKRDVKVSPLTCLSTWPPHDPSSAEFLDPVTPGLGKFSIASPRLQVWL